jgi:periplasmic divalent cation tolerance protein
MPDIIQIVTTIDDREAAKRLGRRLVDERLVACCQVVGPILSIYRWKGTVEETDEWYCVMKTRPSLYRQVEEAIKALHPYEVPEIIAMTVSGALPDYAMWVETETS